jgi:hypothetical protein
VNVNQLRLINTEWMLNICNPALKRALQMRAGELDHPTPKLLGNILSFRVNVSTICENQ